MVEVALNGLLLDSPYSGTATYTRGLVPALVQAAPDLSFRLFVRDADGGDLGVPVTRLRSHLRHLPVGSAAERADKLAWETVLWPMASVRRRETLMHSLYFAAPVVKPLPTVVTIHDVIPLVVEGYHRSRSSRLYSDLMGHAVQSARAIITVSEHARQDILRVLRPPHDRVFVTQEAVDERFLADPEPGERDRIAGRYRLPHRYVLYIGGSERRKNLETLVRAWKLVVSHMRSLDIGLVLVATFPKPDSLYPDTPGLIRELGLDRDVTLVPSVAEDDKPALYRSALAFCFPSTYEGFGLPPLEAMTSRTPVIASHATSVPEVVGEGGLLLDPLDVPTWADALRTVVDSVHERRRLQEAGFRRARRFSWQYTAQQTADVYRWVLG